MMSKTMKVILKVAMVTEVAVGESIFKALVILWSYLFWDKGNETYHVRESFQSDRLCKAST